jgi:hypothetical protein
MIFCKEICAMSRKDLDLQCFCCTTLLGVIFMERCFYECYANDLRTTTCSGVLDHRTLRLESQQVANLNRMVATSTIGKNMGD